MLTKKSLSSRMGHLSSCTIILLDSYSKGKDIIFKITLVKLEDKDLN